MSISTTIKSIQDIMRQDTGVDGDAQRISPLVWMLFLIIFDDREQEYELLKTNAIDFNIASERHQFGDIDEQILEDFQNAGNAGEYYTPRAVTQFLVDMVSPQLGEKILDPACGHRRLSGLLPGENPHNPGQDCR